jgi:hypothetical protein
MTKVWVQLKPYPLTRVSIQEGDNIDDLKEAVKKKLLFLNGSFPVGVISISSTDSETVFPPTALLSELNSQYGYVNSSTFPFLVTVSPIPDAPFVTAVAISQPGPSFKRKERWEKLNSILDSALKSKKRKADINGTIDDATPERSSIAFSNIPVTEVTQFFKNGIMKEYKQNSEKDIPEDLFSLLYKYICIVRNCYGKEWPNGKEDQRKHFVAPIIFCVASLFKDVIVQIEDSLIGNRVHAHGKFEFMLKRKKKRICIVEVKEQDLDKGEVQNLLGCEVLVDVDNTEVVYGIVSTFTRWIFLKNTDDKVLYDKRTNIDFENDLPKIEDLKEVTAKIYSILSDDSDNV